jgi:hypothetical protein
MRNVFNEPGNVILLIAVMILLIIFVGLILIKSGLVKAACLATVDTMSPSVFQALPDTLRPLKWLCKTLIT